MPESSLQILCKCKENSQSSEHNGMTTNVRCNSTNCINRINGGTIESEPINGVESEDSTETRYINQQSSVVHVCACVSMVLTHFFVLKRNFINKSGIKKDE